MKYYYLINGKIMSANDKMPQGEDYVSLNPTHFNKLDFDIDAKQWHNSLQPCEISESELCLILSNVTKLDYDNQIEVTDIVNASVICKVERCDGECIECNHMAIRIVFKQPKQVEEIEAIEFVEWTNDLIKCDYYPVYNEKTNKLSYWENRKNYTKITTKQLYEIFKNQK